MLVSSHAPFRSSLELLFFIYHFYAGPEIDGSIAQEGMSKFNIEKDIAQYIKKTVRPTFPASRCRD
jgi:hypothetical protein